MSNIQNIQDLRNMIEEYEGRVQILKERLEHSEIEETRKSNKEAADKIGEYIMNSDSVTVVETHGAFGNYLDEVRIHKGNVTLSLSGEQFYYRFDTKEEVEKYDKNARDITKHEYGKGYMAS